MASLREVIRIDAPPEKVWEAVRDPLSLLNWFPGIDSGEMVGNARKLKMGDISITEDIVTVDDELRRFQYTISEMPIPLEFHLSTIDVLEDGDTTLVVYGTDIRPDELAGIIGPAIAAAGAALKAHIEG